MTATIIDGQMVAAGLRVEIAQHVAEFSEKQGFSPGLGVVLVGDDPASATYVRMKRRACADVGMTSEGRFLPADATQAQVQAAIQDLNENPAIHGILVQLPMPGHLDEEAALAAVSLEKDADGLHPVNVGHLTMKGREPLFTPATPTGCMVLLESAGVQIDGARAVVVGRSNLVGMPAAMLLNRANATVTIAHSRTPDLPDLLRGADIVIAAIGKAFFIKGAWLKPGAAVIDVGTNPIPDSTRRSGYRLVGDVDYETAKDVVGFITKVPGGVGPMTITMLLHNTLKAARRFHP